MVLRHYLLLILEECETYFPEELELDPEVHLQEFHFHYLYELHCLLAKLYQLRVAVVVVVSLM